jgi:transcriptional regulator of arginine metabolism
LKRILQELFVRMDHNEHFIMMKTLPGNANAVAELIDQLEWEEVMGTLAGDNTILIVCRNQKHVPGVVQRFADMVQG